MKLIWLYFTFVLILFGQFSYARSSHEMKLNFSNGQFAEAGDGFANEVSEGEIFSSHIWESSDRKWFGKLSLGAQVFSFPDWNFQASEAYLDYRYDSKLNFSIGRAFLDSPFLLDSYWGLSVLQSSSRMEAFQTDLQGLTGFHAKFSEGKFFGHFLLSPLFIPEQGPGVDRENGRVTSENPWFAAPPEQVSLEGSLININYGFQNDSIPDLILDHQFGGLLGFKSDDVEVYASYFNRPSRHLSFLVDPRLVANNDGELSANIQPVFLREHVFSIQGEMQWNKNLKTNHGAYAMVWDRNLNVDNFNYRTEINDYFFVSNSFNFNWNELILDIGHLYSSARQSDDSDFETLEYRRFIYGSAVKLGANYKFDRALKFGLEALYAYEQEGGFLRGRVDYRMVGRALIWLESMFIHDFNQNEVSGSSFEDFDGLDYVKVGVTFEI